MEFRVLYFAALLLITSQLFQVSRCQLENSQPKAKADIVNSGSFVFLALCGYSTTGTNRTREHFYLRRVRNLLQVNTVEPYLVDTFCIFPNNSDRLFLPGEEYVILVDMKNNGKSDLVMIAISGRVYLPNDHDHVVYQLRPQTFVNQRVRPSVTGTFSYSFVISKKVQASKYDLVGTVIYFMDNAPFNATFFDGTIEVVETPFRILVKATIYMILLYHIPIFLWRCSTKLYKKREDIKAKRAQAETTKKAQEEAEAAKKAREEAVAAKKAKREAEAAKKAQEEAIAAKKAKVQAEAATKAKEQAEAAKKAKEQADAAMIAKEQAEAAKKAKEQAEAARKQREKYEIELKQIRLERVAQSHTASYSGRIYKSKNR